MNKNKIILIAAILSYFVISIIFLFKKTEFIFLGDFTKVKVNDSVISVNYSNDSIKYTPAKIYFNNNFIDGYIESSGSPNESYYYSPYNSNGVLMAKNDTLIAYSGDYNLKIGNPTIMDVYTNKDLEILKTIESENGIAGSISYFKNIIFDLNNDNELDSIYSVQLTNDSNITSIIYTIINNKVKVIDIVTGDIDSPNCHMDYYDLLIDFNEDNTYEIIIKKHMGDDSPEYEVIFEYVDGEYLEIKEE